VMTRGQNTPLWSRIRIQGDILILCFLTGALGCGRATAIANLQRRLITHFQISDVMIASSTSALTVNFLRPVSDPNAQGGLALEVAEYVRDNYEGYEGITFVEVSFVSIEKTRPFIVRRNRLVYRFNRSDLGERVRESAADEEIGSSSTPDSINVRVVSRP